MLTLRSEVLLVRIDPDHGGEVLDLVDATTGLQLLGRPPFVPSPARAGDLDEDAWTAAYRGGWQLATPNAGAACVVDGVEHGFHGRASNDPWVVCTSDAMAATLAWHGHGLRVERAFAVAGRVLSISTTWTAASRRVPFIAVEHVALGHALLDPELHLELPGGRAWVADADGGPLRPPARTGPWPAVAAPDRPGLRADDWRLADTGAEYLMVADLPLGRARACNPATGTALVLSWDVALLPHLWIWREARATGGPWGGRGEVVGIEPASVAHGLGLADAVAAGHAHWVGPGASRHGRIELAVEPAGELTAGLAAR